MISCEECELLISLGLDDMLTDVEEEQRNEHLVNCPNCQALQQDLSRLHQELPLLCQEPSPQLGMKIMTQIQEEANKKTTVSNRSKPSKPMFPRYFATAAVFALIVAAAGIGGTQLLSPAPAGMAEPSLSDTVAVEPETLPESVEESSLMISPMESEESLPVESPDLFVQADEPSAEIASESVVPDQGTGATVARGLTESSQPLGGASTIQVGAQEQAISALLDYLAAEDGRIYGSEHIRFVGLSTDGSSYLFAVPEQEEAPVLYVVSCSDGIIHSLS